VVPWEELGFGSLYNFARSKRRRDFYSLYNQRGGKKITTTHPHLYSVSSLGPCPEKDLANVNPLLFLCQANRWWCTSPLCTSKTVNHSL